MSVTEAGLSGNASGLTSDEQPACQRIVLACWIKIARSGVLLSKYAKMAVCLESAKWIDDLFEGHFELVKHAGCEPCTEVVFSGLPIDKEIQKKLPKYYKKIVGLYPG